MAAHARNFSLVLFRNKSADQLAGQPLFRRSVVQTISRSVVSKVVRSVGLVGCLDDRSVV